MVAGDRRLPAQSSSDVASMTSSFERPSSFMWLSSFCTLRGRICETEQSQGRSSLEAVRPPRSVAKGVAGLDAGRMTEAIVRSTPERQGPRLTRLRSRLATAGDG
jgi:hypothetical protein